MVWSIRLSIESGLRDEAGTVGSEEGVEGFPVEVREHSLQLVESLLP
jgi:hypothetical protein